MLFAILGFLLQLSILYLLVTMFILLDLLLWTTRARRFREAKERRPVEQRRSAERRERRRLGDRPSIPVRIPRAPASLIELPIRRTNYMAGMGRKAGL